MRFERALGILAITILMAHSVYAQATPADAGDPQSQAIGQAGRLIGSWVVNVQSVTPFTAFHTFHIGGTMSETTDLLALGGEGPGHGAWERTADGKFASTFELFIFNPDGSPAGRIRVRETITMTDESHFNGIAIADLLLPDGAIIEDIDTSPIVGTRVSILKVRPEELTSGSSSQFSRGRW
jgi:hypothetical protein